MEMIDGSTGERKVVSDQEPVAQFVVWPDSLRLTRLADRPPRAGHRYWVELYTGEEPLGRVTFGGTARIDGTYYELDRDLRDDLARVYVDAGR